VWAVGSWQLHLPSLSRVAQALSIAQHLALTVSVGRPSASALLSMLVVCMHACVHAQCIRNAIIRPVRTGSSFAYQRA
jgi:hypothetical protein